MMRDSDYFLKTKDELLESELHGRSLYGNMLDSDEQTEQEHKRILENIQAKNSWLDEKDRMIKNMLNEYELLRIQAYKAHLAVFSDFEMSFLQKSNIIPGAIKWLKMLENGVDGKPLDKRRKYPEKEDYNILLSKLRKYFNYDGITEIINIIQYGMECEGYYIDFKVDVEGNYPCGLYVPIHPSMKYWIDYGEDEFKLKFYKKDIEGPGRKVIASTFFINELPDILEDYLQWW